MCKLWLLNNVIPEAPASITFNYLSLWCAGSRRTDSMPPPGEPAEPGGRSAGGASPLAPPPCGRRPGAEGRGWEHTPESPCLFPQAPGSSPVAKTDSSPLSQTPFCAPPRLTVTDLLRVVPEVMLSKLPTHLTALRSLQVRSQPGHEVRAPGPPAGGLLGKESSGLDWGGSHKQGTSDQPPCTPDLRPAPLDA